MIPTTWYLTYSAGQSPQIVLKRDGYDLIITLFPEHEKFDCDIVDKIKDCEKVMHVDTNLSQLKPDTNLVQE